MRSRGGPGGGWGVWDGAGWESVSALRARVHATHKCSCCGRSRAGSRRGTRTCTRRACWHTPRAGSALRSRTRPHLQGVRSPRGRTLAIPGCSKPSPPCPPPSLSQVTFAGPVHSFKARWARSIWGAHSVGVPYGERSQVVQEQIGGIRREWVWPTPSVGGSRRWLLAGFRRAWVAPRPGSR